MLPTESKIAAECWSINRIKVPTDRVFKTPEASFERLDSTYRWLCNPYTLPYSSPSHRSTPIYPKGARFEPKITECIISTIKLLCDPNTRGNCLTSRCIRLLAGDTSTGVTNKATQIAALLQADLKHRCRFPYDSALGHPIYLLLQSQDQYEALGMLPYEAARLSKELSSDYGPQPTEQARKKQRINDVD